MASQGHIKIDRKILNWEWYGDSSMVHVFLHLLLNANYSDSRFQGTLVKRGQVIIGRLKLATALGLTERQIRTCLKKLKMTNEITIKATNKFSIVTIVKYDDYQSNGKKSDQQNDHQSDQQPTNNRPTSDQQPTTSNNNKEDKKDKKVLYRDNIQLSEKENNSLISDYGEFFTSKCYDLLSSYKIEKNYKTKSDYLTIKRWVVDAVSKSGVRPIKKQSVLPKVDNREYWEIHHGHLGKTKEEIMEMIANGELE
jgi:hypothetical protein